MTSRYLFASWLVAVLLAPVAIVLACCPAPPSGRPVVNADQTVIILWDAETRTQHFVRRASFKSEADDFGFLVPTPTQPELNESGDEAFPVLAAITAPKIKTVPRPTGGGCGCSAAGPAAATGSVTVLEDKIVAGFRAVVLDAGSSQDLVRWLEANGYAFSPEIQAWAEPYISQGWKITALKVAPSASGQSAGDSATAPSDSDKAADVAAPALRISFKTDRPIFPYREPDPTEAARKLGARSRLLRIYFIADARYQGELTATEPWTGKAVWAGALSPADRKRTLDFLKLPESSGPATWWMTEFEDNWPYRPAPADVYFSRSPDQSSFERPPILQYAEAAPLDVAEVAPYALLIAAVGLLPLCRRLVGRS